MDLVQHLINGLLQGSILALVGLGFSLVWGILNIINLAHSAFIMLAAFFTFYLWAGLGVDPFVTLPLTVVTLFVAGYLLQRYVLNVLAFSVVVLGGLGSIQGALLGGLVFGLVNEFGGTYLLQQRDVIIFAILILVLVVRPTGLLGREGYR